MRVAWLVWLVLVGVTGSARASDVTVVATGDTDLQPLLAQQLEGWLRGHGHSVAPSLSAEATSTLLNCMVTEDQGCARGLLETQAKGEAVLFGQAITSRTNNAVVLNLYWFIKGKEPIGMRRACEECSPDLMRSTVDEMLTMIVGASKAERGRLALSSKPAGMTVLLDNETIGVTPLEREVAAGSHTIVLMHRGRKVGERTIKVHAEVTAEISIPVTLPVDDTAGPRARRSPLVGGLVMGLGGASLVAGVALFVTSEEDDGSKLYYRDTRALGVGLSAGGVALAGVGVWLWLRARGGDSTSSAPIVSLTPHGGLLGWSHGF